MTSAEVIARAEQARLAADAAKGTPEAFKAASHAEKWALYAEVARRAPNETWVTGTPRGVSVSYTGVIDQYAGSMVRLLVPWRVSEKGIDAHGVWIEAVSLSPEDNDALGDFWVTRGCLRVPAVQW
jgi:hypothetical protein